MTRTSTPRNYQPSKWLMRYIAVWVTITGILMLVQIHKTGTL